MKSKALRLLLLGLCCYGAARFCHHQTSGFRVSKITSSYLEEFVFSDPPFTEKEEALLQGRFTYFGRGLQSFAFLSEDGNYVLKIFNNRLQKKHALFKTLRLQKSTYEMEQKLKRTFESYKIAYEELKEETGILYMHLTPRAALKRKITLIDKLGIAHKIDLNKTGFILQKRATLAYPWLKELIARNEINRAKEAIAALVNLLVQKNLRGIADNDPLIRTNFGFIDNLPLQIDIGPFSINPQVKDPNFYLPEMRRITASLKNWLQDNCPELVLHLEIILKNMEKPDETLSNH